MGFSSFAVSVYILEEEIVYSILEKLNILDNYQRQDRDPTKQSNLK